MLEALWLHQSLDVVDEGLLGRMLACPEPRARAAATRVLCYWRDRVEDPLGASRTQINDPHPRVRLEAVRALSFFTGEDAATAQQIALESLLHPQDYYLEYTLGETNRTLDRRLKALGASPSGESPLVRLLQGGRGPEGRQDTIVEVIGRRGTAGELAALYQRAIRPGGFSDATRLKALDALAAAAQTRKARPLRRPDRPGPPDPAGWRRSGRGRAPGRGPPGRPLEGGGAGRRAAGDRPVRRGGRPPARRRVRGHGGDRRPDRPGAHRGAGRGRPAVGVRAGAVAALARLDAAAAAERAVAVLRDAADGQDLAPVVAAFFNQQGGAAALAAAATRHACPPTRPSGRCARCTRWAGPTRRWRPSWAGWPASMPSLSR
jgi:hypothetical protein